MTTEYRMLEKWEPVEKGDEYQDWDLGWQLSDNWNCKVNPKREQMSGTQYRRPLPKLPVCVPQWKHPDTPGCPVHVLWAESPSTVRTVAQVAAEAKPGALKTKIEPGTGYRLLELGEVILNTDERLRDGNWAIVASGAVGMNKLAAHMPMRRKLPAPLCPIDPPAGYYILGPDEVWRKGDMITSGNALYGWCSLASCNFGTTTNTWTRCKEPRWCCRKLPVPEPQYRPYANTAEAAEGLQGKLIRHKNSEIYHTVSQIDWAGVTVADGRISFSGIQNYWKFTDGTPCGVLSTNQGKQ